MCEKCLLVAEDQKTSTLRMAVWHAQAQDEAHVAKQVSQYPKEGVTVTSALYSGFKNRIRNLLNSLHSPTVDRTHATAPVAPTIDSRAIEGGGSICLPEAEQCPPPHSRIFSEWRSSAKHCILHSVARAAEHSPLCHLHPPPRGWIPARLSGAATLCLQTASRD
jgi:hypothetical protein